MSLAEFPPATMHFCPSGPDIPSHKIKANSSLRLTLSPCWWQQKLRGKRFPPHKAVSILVTSDDQTKKSFSAQTPSPEAAELLVFPPSAHLERHCLKWSWVSLLASALAGHSPQRAALFSLPIPELRAWEAHHIVCTSEYTVSTFRSNGACHLVALNGLKVRSSYDQVSTP